LAGVRDAFTPVFAWKLSPREGAKTQSRANQKQRATSIAQNFCDEVEVV